ncbi:HlyD family secretion protein [Ideonella oryzae]|uniref:HlyD family secretion protein n=1 Tax=Ideonella oryzae TaxID=2937441 RepID=A0ABT1BGD9_9BURK|nr:HlyD family efflux transporter periplasmic adaptor subunit [Ideonella oryzae]MCO5975113.1 HlyD family secretion protein [Ideonella oryzae]
MNPKLAKFLPLLAVAALAGAGYFAWSRLHDTGPGPGFVSGNGRLEGTEIDVAAKLGGRVEDILVNEGDFVKAGQPLASMQIQSLQAQRDEAEARVQQAVQSVASAQAQVALRESDVQAVVAQVAQREAELDAARRKLARSEELSHDGASSGQELDDDRARMRGAQAALVATQAQVRSAQAAVTAAKAQVTATQASASAAQASVDRIDVDLADSILKSPRDGRVQYRIAQPGEVVGAGGKVLNLVDLTDVSMTFFLPETAAGRVALGSEVRLVLDAASQYVIPAKVSFVASIAQFTPKTVETATERQKLMFKVKARIDPVLLRRHLQQVKTGLPGVAWVRLDPQQPWPATLDKNVVEANHP